MLTSHDQHVWSATGLDGSWVVPGYYQTDDHNGGSAIDYPKDTVAGDARRHFSFWGSDSARTGGCCSTSTGEYRTGWDKSFTLSYGVIDLPLPPPNTALILVAEVAGTILANDAFWTARCDAIPEAALYARLVMGTVRDALLSCSVGCCAS
jgi:hypothetical protein